MKFSVTKDKILDGLQRVQNVVSTRTTLPILSNTLIQAEKSGVTFTTTDLDMAVRCRVDATVTEPGATTLPAKRLFTILKEVSATDIEIDVDENNHASIRCGSSFYKIMGLPQDEFPPFPRPDSQKSFKIEQPILRDMLKKTAYAVSNDETRYVLNGVHLNITGEKITVVATDGRRLALVEREMDLPKGLEAEFIIPTKAVNELQHLLGDKGDAHLSVAENQIICAIDDTMLVSKLVDGAYPNYRQVIPTEAKERIPLDRETFLAALHRASILASEKTQSIKLDFGKGRLVITCSSPDVGEAQEEISIAYKGKEIVIAFNPQFLMEPLRHLDADEVFMELTDEISPGVLKIKEPFLYVIMPMRLN